MSMPRQNSVAPKLPTLPQGEQIAVHSTYLDAQKAVEALSDKGFPVQQVTIVGTDLKMVERVTGRLTYPRVAVAGMASGAWFGLFVGLLLTMFSPEGSVYSIVAAIGIGAGFGLLFSVLSFSLTRGKRDFTSSSQIVASSYAVLCERETAGQATQILREANLLGRPAPAQAAHPLASAQPVQPPAYGQSYAAATPPAAAPQAPAAAAPSPQHVTPSGEPRYGVRVVDGKPQYPGSPQQQAPVPPVPQPPAPQTPTQQPSAPQPPADV
jgi:hypothetical protein